MSTVAEFAWTLHSSNPEFDPVFERAPFAWARCDREGKITEWNPALERVLSETSLGPSPASLCFPDLMQLPQRPQAERLFRELFEQQRDSFQVEFHSDDLHTRPMRWTAWRVPRINGRSEHALVLGHEIPEDQEAAQRLRQAEKLEAVGRLAGSVAHDFNNLLTGILLYCDLLLGSLEPGDRSRKYAEEIRNAGHQASSLVRQLLTVARPANLEPRLISLNETVECMRNLLVRLIGENIRLQFCLDPNLGLVKMDPTHSQQILLNLVLNARDAMPGGGQISVKTSNCKIQVLPETALGAGAPPSLPCALFVVDDNGSGMDAHTRAHLFEAFFTTKASKGTGLGLKTVHDIVTRYGGLIHVDSAPACGTRVSVLLPLALPLVADPSVLDLSPGISRSNPITKSQNKKEESTP